MTDGFYPSTDEENEETGPAFTNMELQFPQVEPGVIPLGTRVLVQIRVPKRMVGSIIIPEDIRDTEQDNTTVAKVLGFGPAAFRKRTDLVAWPEGLWVEVGDFVMVPRYAGQRWKVKSPQTKDEVELAMFEDLNLIAKVTGDPLSFKAFL